MARNDLRLVWDGCPPAALKIAIGHDVGFFTGPEGTCIDAETPEQMRDFLSDYCRVKIDAEAIKAGEPMYAGKAQRCIHEWVYDPFEDMDVCQRCDLQVSNVFANDPNRTAGERRQ